MQFIKQVGLRGEHFTNKAIIIGASSGIGRELAKIFSRENYNLGLAARRSNLLFEIQKELPTKSYIKSIDIFINA
ncbi:SDR family NAD(P)-dependent oxidoreductase [Clostridium sp. ZBS15]|uniref:SDR family NAD(P)-dependent oxidoreductase n=1 Tax=Clostridium sp. ZBS15 TaxID=2949969 RepID=UPI00338F6EC8